MTRQGHKSREGMEVLVRQCALCVWSKRKDKTDISYTLGPDPSALGRVGGLEAKDLVLFASSDSEKCIPKIVLI